MHRAWSFVAPFTASNNMVTPKMSIRRREFLACLYSSIYDFLPLYLFPADVVIKTYEEIINGLYEGQVDSGGSSTGKQQLEVA